MWREIPGTRQDHKGRDYTYWVNSHGKVDIRYCAAIALSPATQARLEPVTVTSQSLLPLDNSPKIILQRLKAKRLHRQGETYTSMRLYQGER